MTILVTGSAGHLGEALVRTLRAGGEQVRGLDIRASEFTDCVGSVVDSDCVAAAVQCCSVIVHTATLHKPHVGTHSRQNFIDPNVSGTLNLLEAAVQNHCRAFIYTSTTSTFGDAMRPAAGEPAVWVTEDLRPQPRNIYGVTKTAAEDLCALFHRNTRLPCIVLKTSRFFPEADDMKQQREQFDDTNQKVNELRYRRADIADVVSAHRQAIIRAAEIGFDRFIISSTPPFSPDDAAALGRNAPAVVEKYVPQYKALFQSRNWSMVSTLDRVYDNSRARQVLGWTPEYTFERAIELLADGRDYRSDLTLQIATKGYHDRTFDDGPYPVTGF